MTAVVVALVVGLATAGCGSRLDPETVGAVSGGTGSAEAGGNVGPGGSSGVDGPKSGPGGELGPDATAGPAAAGAAPGGPGASAKGDGSSAPPAGSGVKAASCAGLAKQTGVDAKTIVIGNAADISGPVPGLFQSAQDGVRAYVAYFNATNDICGRKLELKTYDSRTDAGADQQAYTSACDEVFAMVGSQSGFDAGGAGKAESCGLPDIRSRIITDDRAECSTCFATYAINGSKYPNAPADFVLQSNRGASQKAAVVYINVAAGKQSADSQTGAYGKRGLKYVYVQGIDAAEFNYAPYVQDMKSKGVETFSMSGSYQHVVRFANAMKQQGFKPKVWLQDATLYNQNYVEQGGSAVEGTTTAVNFTPFEEASKSKELQTYLAWLQQVRPGAKPSTEGVFAWSAAKLFVEKSLSLGGRLSRKSMLEAIRSTNSWTAGDLHAPQPVGSKGTGDCWRFLQLQGGSWKPVGGTKYQCKGTSPTS